MNIDGSNEFKNQVNSALSLWRSVDKNANSLESTIAYIKETDDDFKVRTYADGGISIARNTAFWPSTGAIVQQRILASYIAHESIHAYSLAQGSDKWNTPEVEQLALDYQAEIAGKLGISDLYVSNPKITLNDESIDRPNTVEVSKPLAILIGITAVVILITNTFKSKRRSLVNGMFR